MHKQFLRRMLYVQLTEPMIVNLNITNVEVNNHTQIYNNTQTIEDFV